MNRTDNEWQARERELLEANNAMLERMRTANRIASDMLHALEAEDELDRAKTATEEDYTKIRRQRRAAIKAARETGI